MRFDAVMVMGKELRLDPQRGRRELAARAAAASATLREFKGEGRALSLEATLRGQEESGTQIVQKLWSDLGVPADRMVLRNQTYSTRQEAMLASALMESLEIGRIAVFTASYHLERTRTIFAEHLDLDRFCVLPPEAALRIANPQERDWILSGAVGPDALQFERSRERRWSALSAGMQWLGQGPRWRVECLMGRVLRRAGV